MSEQKTPADDLIGKTLGQYTILEEIGRGGMATVYRARQISMNRVVAVKVLPRHFLHDPGFYDRFVREIKVASELEHPHILPVYDYGEAEGIPYIVMRYLGGGSLAQMIRRGVPSLNALEKPFTQIAQALDYAHVRGVIHRDLKPGNIMLDEHGNAYLSDFGIARVFGSDLTGSAIIGTPAYMSPEQAHGLPIDGRSDIYSLGVVLFELITGSEPYQAETPMALLLKHINEPMPPLRNYRDDIPDALEDVIFVATAKDPDKRFSSASDMAEAFREALHSPDAAMRHAATAETRRPIGTAPVGVPHPAGSASGDFPTASVPQTGPVTTPGVAMRGGPSAGVLITAVVIVAILVVGAVIALPRIANQPGGSTVNIEPTAFPRASVIHEKLYSISIPNDWIPPALFYDRSDENRMEHGWQADDNSAFVTLSLVDAGLRGNGSAFEAAIADYDRRYYEPQGGQIHLIDEATAEDGSLRRSYRLEGSQFPYGQMDVFYMERRPYLAVLEMYTADSTASTLVPRMQLILDSLRVTPPQVSAG